MSEQEKRKYDIGVTKYTKHKQIKYVFLDSTSVYLTASFFFPLVEYEAKCSYFFRGPEKQNTFDLFIIKEIWGLDQEGFGDLNEGPII